MLENSLTDLGAAPHDQVEDALRQSGAAENVRQRPGAARHEIGGLEHHGVAVGERRRDFPGRNGDRKVPGRDQADDADRLARDLDIDIGPHRGELLASNAKRLPSKEGKDLSGAHDLADPLSQGLALLAGEQSAEFVLAG